jgi:hypothetical protein
MFSKQEVENYLFIVFWMALFIINNNIKMFKSLSDYKDKKDDDKKKKTTSYTGGEKSGMAVENPDKQSDLESIMEKARQGGQQHASEGGGKP